MKIFIKRRRGEFGPYSAETVQVCLEQSIIEPHDLAQLTGEQSYELLPELLHALGFRSPCPSIPRTLP